MRRMRGACCGGCRVARTSSTPPSPCASGELLDLEVVTTSVRFTPLSPEAIEWYLATGEPLDKAGAYAIQGAGGVFVEA